MVQYIKPITSDHDLIALAKHLNVHIDQILTLPEIKSRLPDQGTYIFLPRSDGGVGHWVCQHNGKYFEPMGVGPPRILGDLKYNEKKFQSTYSEFCGPWCMLWLYTQQHSEPELLRTFNNLDTDAI
ncbi:hypothetical protein PHYSODRAFT_497485 [Phytophthora sojae]|uniref:Uncharacterized protein n=1 Tax=Phytophthora sojae (strain P6497) TaxID=1094619 RepID=G4ZBL2_PHYSP|nr:hypothetical protein PHYSODRAFT_497485 [Phytophthora sojae]EGZ20626.1 hypothetical protein PHYSODRAFT_497485 [Phytophthora sojae]|eukprot:XP_009523343.1 hypothetical protein PHYSODRAFT_497485 [Phytophthora sojae]